MLHLHTVYNHFTDNSKAPIVRVPTVMENPGKKWSWKVMEKSWKIAKIQNFIEICFSGKSHGNQLSKST